ncbi:MAG TPA: ankyrin repeat domain-containing protein [Candidatus Babeliales bacterium]|nr:ankyrin repeat domain-containing protein [Candidatus Babeliales bacterium]
MLKKNKCFIALLLIAFTCNVFSMEPLESEEAQTAREESGIDDNLNIYMNEVLFGKKSHSTWFLEKLPLDVQQQITNLLTVYDIADSLTICAQITNSLTQVNKELNEIINNPHFCLELIKHLSKRFNCSNSEVANTLKTKEARRRFMLQMDLYNICNETRFNTKDYYLQTLQSLCDQGVDLEFTYNMLLSHFQNLGTFPTPLMIASIHQNHTMMHCLIQIGSEVNQKTHNGKTALMLLPTFKNMSRNTLKILLDAGANPTLADTHGDTALTIAKRVHNKRVVEQLTNAIENWNNKK